MMERMNIHLRLSHTHPSFSDPRSLGGCRKRGMCIQSGLLKKAAVDIHVAVVECIMSLVADRSENAFHD